MKNIKGIAVATDGNLKRIAVTYDDVDETTGKILKSNARTNRVVMDSEVTECIVKLEQFAQSVVEHE